MKFYNNIAVALFLLGLFCSPFFVYAGYDCYVDAGEESGGDGSEEHPYEKISKALEEKCENIYVKEGTYGDNIVLNDGVKIKGSDQNKIIITGSVLMKEHSKLEKVTVSGKGIKVNDNDNANIIGVTVERPNIGIEPSGH